MVKERLKNDGMNMNLDNRPCFFKIIYDGLTTENLFVWLPRKHRKMKENQRVPPKFVKYVWEELSDRAILKGPSGNSWHVQVRKKEHRMYLKSGWQCFLSDHSLGDNEFLMFRYDGNMCFNVQIFDKNGCERVGVSVINSEQESVFPNGKSKQGRSRRKPVGSLQVHRLKPNKKGPGRSPNEEEREKVLEATKSFTSKFPYFKTCLKPSSTRSGFILPIPVSFAGTNLPKSRTKITLLYPKGRAWEVICVYNGKRYAFSGGWGAFVRGNKLKVGDVCLFELVDKDKMQVHIF